MSRILVTGATGFLGSAIVRKAVASGVDVRQAGRKSVPRVQGPEYFQGDLRDISHLKRIVTGMDAVIHSGGIAHRRKPGREDVSEMFRVNAEASRQLAAAAATSGVRQFVLVSSVAAFDSFRPEQKMRASAYAASKRASEDLCGDVSRGTSMQLVILRMATLYGEEDPGNMARLIRSIDRGRFVWLGSGRNRKTVIYREDAAAACVAAATFLSNPEGTYTVSAETPRMMEIVDIVSQELEKTLPRWRIPAHMALGSANVLRILGVPFAGIGFEMVSKWLSEDMFPGAEFRNRFGVTPQVPLREGLRREVQWFRSLSS